MGDIDIDIDNKISSTEEIPSALPLKVILNVRQKIKAQNIPAKQFIKKEKKKDEGPFARVWCQKEEIPIVVRPMSISWEPSILNFEVGHQVIVKKLMLLNRSPRCLYMHVCGFWDGQGLREGAEWRCYPRKRIFMVPGLDLPVWIRVTPKLKSSVPYAFSCLQVATGYPKELVNALFEIPIQVKFKNYCPPLNDQGNAGQVTPVSIVRSQVNVCKIK